MRSNFVRAGSRHSWAPPPLSIVERLEIPRYEECFGDFTAAAWHHAGEPQSFQSNWHIDCIVDHLMAVARREIKGPGPLIFTLPPRHMKSRGVNVFFPAWVWAQDPDPDHTGHGLMVRPGTLLGRGVRFAHLSYVSQHRNQKTPCISQSLLLPLFQVIASKRPRTIGSEYLRDGTAPGATNAAGMRHEDATRLTFPDCAFDDIGTFDVLEHVPNYHRALAEFFRCLRPNGTLIITVPFSLWSAATVTRATIDTSGNITHLLPPETHDDPINQGGALAFYTFGWDLMGALTEVGFKDTGISIYWNPQLGYLGGYQYVGVKLIKRIFKVRSRFSQRLTANESIALNPSRHVFLPKLVGYSVDDQFSGMYCPDQL